MAGETMEFVLGKDCKITLSAAGGSGGGSGGTGGSELTIVKEASLTCETGEANVTTRGSGGWEATAATLRKLSLDIKLQYKPADPGYVALRNAWKDGTKIGITALTADGEGPTGDFMITKFSRSEPLEEGVMVDVTAKLTKFISWNEGTQPTSEPAPSP